MKAHAVALAIFLAPMSADAKPGSGASTFEDAVARASSTLDDVQVLLEEASKDCTCEDERGARALCLHAARQAMVALGAHPAFQLGFEPKAMELEYVDGRRRLVVKLPGTFASSTTSRCGTSRKCSVDTDAIPTESRATLGTKGARPIPFEVPMSRGQAEALDASSLRAQGVFRVASLRVEKRANPEVVAIVREGKRVAGEIRARAVDAEQASRAAALERCIPKIDPFDTVLVVEVEEVGLRFWEDLPSTSAWLRSVPPSQQSPQEVREATEREAMEREANDVAASAESLRTECSKSSPVACARLGHAYATGRGQAQDRAVAAQVLGSACDLEAWGACRELGLLLLEGRGESERARARRLLLEACYGSRHISGMPAGDAEACYRLAQEKKQGWSDPDDRGYWEYDKLACRRGYQPACKRATP